MKYTIFDWNKARRTPAYGTEQSNRKEVAMYMLPEELDSLERRALANGEATQSTLFNVDVTVTVDERQEQLDYQQTVDDASCRMQ